jgi:Family of unknown function (DUF5946)
MTATIACPGCGARVPDIAGPVHVYVPSAPGCWAAFGELRADEMYRFPGSTMNNLTVDTYMAQHPGDGTDRRDRQSVFIHLAAMCAVVDPGALGDPGELGERAELNVLHLSGARDIAEHDTRVREWAESVWSSWRTHQAGVRAALDAATATNANAAARPPDTRGASA